MTNWDKIDEAISSLKRSVIKGSLAPVNAKQSKEARRGDKEYLDVALRQMSKSQLAKAKEILDKAGFKMELMPESMETIEESLVCPHCFVETSDTAILEMHQTFCTGNNETTVVESVEIEETDRKVPRPGFRPEDGSVSSKALTTARNRVQRIKDSKKSDEDKEKEFAGIRKQSGFSKGELGLK